MTLLTGRCSRFGWEPWEMRGCLHPAPSGPGDSGRILLDVPGIHGHSPDSRRCRGGAGRAERDAGGAGGDSHGDGPRPAAAGAVRRVAGPHAAGRPGQVDAERAADRQAAAGARAGDARADAGGDVHLDRWCPAARHPERHARARQAGMVHLDHAEPVAGDPELLGWHPGDHLFFAGAALAAAGRPRRGRQQHRRLDQVADPAGDDAVAVPGGGPVALREVQPARSLLRRLRAHRARQGAERRTPSCTATRCGTRCCR